MYACDFSSTAASPGDSDCSASPTCGQSAIGVSVCGWGAAGCDAADGSGASGGADGSAAGWADGWAGAGCVSGAGDADAARYEALLVMLARERLCDALDVELSVGEAAFSRIARAAHEAGMPVIGSCHDFEKTPDAEEMAARLCQMAALGADVCKIAVMPRKRRDVVALTAACAQADDALTQPIIAISMGEMGMPTRICAEAMGSCLSFGTAGAASAPGQMEAGALREALALVHRALAREAQEF